MMIRLILGFLFVLGLVTAWCAQLGEVVDLSAASSIRRAAAAREQSPLPEEVLDAAATLERNSRLWKTSLSAGIAIVVAASVGLSLVRRAPAGGSHGGG